MVLFASMSMVTTINEASFKANIILVNATSTYTVIFFINPASHDTDFSSIELPHALKIV